MTVIETSWAAPRASHLAWKLLCKAAITVSKFFHTFAEKNFGDRASLTEISKQLNHLYHHHK